MDSAVLGLGRPELAHDPRFRSVSDPSIVQPMVKGHFRSNCDKDSPSKLPLRGWALQSRA